MKITVHYFAAAREASGHESESVDVADGMTVAELQGALIDRHPGLGAVALRWAVGERFVPETRTLEDGDQVALLPPVSGG